MAKVRASFANTGSGFELIPDGEEVDAVVYEAGLHTSKAGNLSVKWQFRVSDGPFEGRFLWMYTTIEPGANQWALQAVLEAADVEAEEDDDGNIEFDTEDVIGSPVRIQVAIQEANGDYKASNQVGKIMAP